MQADWEWERSVQTALGWSATCQGALRDAVDEWRRHDDAAASRERVGELLERAKKRARLLVIALDQVAVP